MTLVAIIRPRDKLAASCAQAIELGFEVICASPIGIEVRPSREFDAFLEAPPDARDEAIVFTSATGIQAAFELAERQGRRDLLLSRLRGARVAAIGPATARRLEKEGLGAPLIPEEFTSRGLVAAAKGWGIEGARAFIIRSDSGSSELPPGLEEAGLEAHEIVVYRLHNRGDQGDVAKLVEAGQRGDVDVFLFTSSLSSRTLIEAWAGKHGLDSAVRAINSKRVAAIGPPTRTTLESYGIRVDVVPCRATFWDLLIAVKESTP